MNSPVLPFSAPIRLPTLPWRFTCTVFAAVLLACGRTASAEDDDSLPSTEELKKLSLDALMSIDVTSVSKQTEKLSKTASAIQVITAEDILRSGASSLPEALRLASNLQVAQVNSHQWAISARGFNASAANKLLVLVDGRTVYTPLYSGVFWDVQDTLLEDLDRIEVISGPGATLWGANAVNGVINVLSKSSKDTQGWLVSSGGGTELEHFVGARYGGKLAPDVHFRVYGKYFGRDSALLSSGAGAANDWRMGQGGFRLDWDASNTNLVTVQGDIYRGHIAQPGANADIDVNGGNLLTRWSHTISDTSNFQLQLYYDRTHRNLRGLFSEDLDSYDLDFHHRFPLGDRHNIVWGLGYRLIVDDIVNTPVLAILPSQLSRQWFSGFVQDEITLVPERLHLTLGTKLEHNDDSGFEYQPSGRLGWLIDSRQTLWAAVSRAVRTPSRIDQDFFAPGTPPYFILQGGPNFVSEELLAYELGYRIQPHPRLSLSLATFYNDYDNIRSTEQVTPPLLRPVILANGQEGESYGAELTADFRPTDYWRIRAGYTALHVRIRAQPGSTDTSRGSGEANDPSHQLSIRSSIDLPWNLEFDTGFRYVSELSGSNVPAYSELDVRLGWRPTPQVEFSIIGQNLLNDSHPEFGAAASRQQIERSVYGKVTLRF